MEQKHKITILVTGFGPFGLYPINPSWEAVKLLPNLFKTHKESSDVNLIVVKVPVSYENVESKIKELWEKYSPSIILHIGVSHNATCLTIEKNACNKGYNIPDILNQFPTEYNEECIKFQTNCEIEKICGIVNQCSETNCSAEISNDAGRYLCEYIYYQSLALIDDKKKPQVLFVHIPPFDVYTSNQSAKGLLKIILILINDELVKKIV